MTFRQFRQQQGRPVIHHAPMTPNPFAEEIQQLQTQLTELEADAKELQRLHDERAAQVAELATSRDFAKRAELEGQRAAFKKMLTDQRAEVQRTRESLTALEREAVRDTKLTRIGELSRIIEAARQEEFTARQALRDALEPLLLPILEADTKWARARRQWIETAQEIGINVHRYSGQDADALYAELEARGVDTGPLRWDRNEGTEVQGSRFAPPLPSEPAATAFTAHLDVAVMTLVGNAHAAMNRVKGGQDGIPFTPTPETGTPGVVARLPAGIPDVVSPASEVLNTP